MVARPCGNGTVIRFGIASVGHRNPATTTAAPHAPTAIITFMRCQRQARREPERSNGQREDADADEHHGDRCRDGLLDNRRTPMKRINSPPAMLE